MCLLALKCFFLFASSVSYVHELHSQASTAAPRAKNDVYTKGLEGSASFATKWQVNWIADQKSNRAQVQKYTIASVGASAAKNVGNISICVGATFSHVLSCANGLLSWLSLSTLLPADIIFGVSEADKWKTVDAFLSEEVIQSLSGVRILFLVRSGRFNQAENRNLAADHATTDLLSFWDIDDVMHSRRIEMIIRHFINTPDSSALLHRYATVSNFGEISIQNFVVSDLGHHRLESISYLEAKQMYQKARRESPSVVLWCCGPLAGIVTSEYHNAWLSMRKSAFDAERFNESWTLYRSEDSDLTMRLFLNGQNVSLSVLKLGLYAPTNIKKLPLRPRVYMKK